MRLNSHQKFDIRVQSNDLNWYDILAGLQQNKEKRFS